MIEATAADVGRYVVHLLSDGSPTCGRIVNVNRFGVHVALLVVPGYERAIRTFEASDLYWLDAFPKLLTSATATVQSLSRGLTEIASQGVHSPAFASRADETAAALRDLKEAVGAASGGHT
jgi:hypothetical protein